MKWIGICMWLVCLTASAKVVLDEPVTPAGSASTIRAVGPVGTVDVRTDADEPARTVVPKEVWVGEVGSTVKTEIGKWTKRAKGPSGEWKLIWDTKTDYTIDVEVRFEGRLDEAVGSWIKLYETGDKPLSVQFQMDQRLIYVTNKKP